MAKPIVHARSSVKLFGGSTEMYEPIHELCDWSKSAHASVRHRVVFHHTTGAMIARRIFGPEIVIGPPAHSVPTARVVEQHVTEDLGLFPSLARYLSEFDSALLDERLLRRSVSLDTQCRISIHRFGGVPDDYRDIHAFIDLVGTAPGTDDALARSVLHHAFGCFVVERAFGKTIDIGDKTVHVRDVAERHIIHELGYIPDLGDWTKGLVLKPWMAGSRKPVEACND